MAVINPHTTRGTGTVLTAAIYNADHQNHITNANSLNAELISDTAAIAVLDGRLDTAEPQITSLLPLLGKPTVQEFNASGTWTKPTNCKRIIVEAVGGGGGSGGCTGALSNYAATGGGGSGFFGRTNPIDVTAVANGAVVIGAGGAQGAAGNNAGGTGGSTTITIGVTTYTWPGGDGSPGATANGSNGDFTLPGTWAALGTNVKGSSNQGGTGFTNAADTNAFSGPGAPSPYGKGGDRVVQLGTGGAAGNAAAANTGAGASGGATNNQATNRAGAAGGSGYMRVWEFY